MMLAILVLLLSVQVSPSFLMFRRPPRSTPVKSSAASDVYSLGTLSDKAFFERIGAAEENSDNGKEGGNGD